ncbi:helix-turn-helix domain-containing protein [Halolamina rubra]|uniref:helix-turn-helix domain-containing protein n=1 Tax=Halolamina rubra TaxID=1380430 RepID=UPI00067923A0|nr:helix-turn-helix domain-containing protein [Halolamina rubra]
MSITHVNEEPSSGRDYQQVKMSLWHSGCWTLQTTDAHPKTHIIEKSLYPANDIIKGDFILITKGDTSMDEFIAAIDESAVVNNVAVLKQSDERARVVVNYASESSIVPEIVRSEFMPIAPVHITEGKEHWRVMVQVDALSDVLESLRSEYDVEVDAIEQVDPTEGLMFADVVNSISENLSPRQREVLFNARDEGYYNWPRDVSANDIAENAGVSGPTFLEHLRQGEQKIIHRVLDEIQIRQKRL